MRGTMATIGLAAALIRLRDPQAVVGSFAADHHISDEAAFQGAVSRAIEAAEAGYVVTIGIEFKDFRNPGTPSEPAGRRSLC